MLDSATESKHYQDFQKEHLALVVDFITKIVQGTARHSNVAENTRSDSASFQRLPMASIGWLRGNNTTVDDLTELIQQQGQQITALKLMVQERCANGVFYWEIRNYPRIKEQARQRTLCVVHSPSFYSSYYGYRFCLRINVGGFGEDSGPRLSLFIHMCIGENDEMLDWPFRGQIVLSLLSRSGIPDAVHITERFSPDPRLEAFQRPTSDRSQKGFGYVNFATLDTVEKQRYVSSDGKIVVKCIVKSQGT